MFWSIKPNSDCSLLLFPFGSCRTSFGTYGSFSIFVSFVELDEFVSFVELYEFVLFVEVDEFVSFV